MFQIKAVILPSFKEAIVLTAMVVAIISVCIIRFEAAPHVPILFSIFLLICYGLAKKVPYRELEKGLVEGAGAGMGAVFLFFLIGILISSWMMSGTIPTLIYAGFNLVTPLFFFAIVFVVTSLIGLSIGSSLTTVATVGVAFIGIAGAMDLSLAVTAGAIVSGAFFGDKMSPLSDTTNLAASIVGIDLFEHIRNMGWTTIPAFVLTFIFFAVLSPDVKLKDTANIELFKNGLQETGLIHWYAMLPLIVLILLTLAKMPALLTLALSSMSAVALSSFHQSVPFSDMLGTLFAGYVSKTGIEQIDELLTRGGMQSMFFTIGLVLLALSMGGMLFKLGIIQCLLAKIESLLRKVSSVIAASALTAIGVNILIGEQYLSILLTGQAFKESYAKLGLASKNLSRVMEDAGTVVNPLVPWSVCGIFITSVLGISTLEYVPFAFFCLLSPILTVIFGFANKTLTYVDKV